MSCGNAGHLRLLDTKQKLFIHNREGTSGGLESTTESTTESTCSQTSSAASAPWDPTVLLWDPTVLLWDPMALLWALTTLLLTTSYALPTVSFCLVPKSVLVRVEYISVLHKQYIHNNASPKNGKTQPL